MKKILICLCLLMSTSLGWAAEPIKIAFIGPMTGEFSIVGRESKQVLTLLASDLNDQGGLLGRKVDLLFEDDGGKSESALPVGKSIVRQNVVAVVGSFTSTVTESLQSIFDEAKIIHISYGSSAVSLTGKGLRYFFRTCPQDRDQAKAIVNLIRKNKGKKIALLHDNSLYGKELAEQVRDVLHDWMIDVVSYESLQPGRNDYRADLEKIKAKGADMVFFAGYYPEAAKLLSGREQMKWSVPFLGGDAVNNPGLVKLAGKKATEDFHFLSPPIPFDLNSPRAKLFLQRYREAYGETPVSIHALLAGEAFIAVTDSIRRQQTTDPDKISAYLHLKYFNPAGLTGPIYFDYKGDVVNNLYGIYSVDSEGRFILQRLVQQGLTIK
ncbi:MAG: branched-chain amino acid ABC transporter substrate-binding protein [Smithella sp.]